MKRGINVVDLEAIHGMAIRDTLPVSALPEFFQKSFARLEEYIQRKGGKYAGPPFAVYYNVPTETVDVELVFPVVFDVLENLPAEGEIHPVDFPGGDAVEYVYFGPYDGMAPAYGEVMQWLQEHGKVPGGPPREVYLSEPEGDPSTWETHIVQPFLTAA
jgi:AraC family transcriptional regulator